MPRGATVLDVGCGTGLNVPGLLRAVGPAGQVIGVDSSSSMLARADRRVAEVSGAGAFNVRLLTGDARELPAVLARAGIETAGIGAVVATFVLSVLDDDEPFWRAVDQLAGRRPLRVGIADVGPVDTPSTPLRAAYRLLSTLGGADPGRRPWEQLERRSADAAVEQHLHGHVRIAAGTCRGPVSG